MHTLLAASGNPKPISPIDSYIVTSNQSKAVGLLKVVKLKGEIVLPDDVGNQEDPPGQCTSFELPALFCFIVGNELSKDTIIQN